METFVTDDLLEKIASWPYGFVIVRTESKSGDREQVHAMFCLHHPVSTPVKEIGVEFHARIFYTSTQQKYFLSVHHVIAGKRRDLFEAYVTYVNASSAAILSSIYSGVRGGTKYADIVRFLHPMLMKVHEHALKLGEREQVTLFLDIRALRSWRMLSGYGFKAMVGQIKQLMTI